MQTWMGIGRLAADPEGGKTNSGIEYARFTLAVDRRVKDKDGNRQADFVRCEAWRGAASIVMQYLHKGDSCAVTGEWHNKTYKAQDGSTRYSWEVVVDQLRLLGSKREAATSPEGFTEVEDDELPW